MRKYLCGGAPQNLFRICLLNVLLVLSGSVFSQTIYDSVATAGQKYTLLEVTVNKNDLYTPDADQDVIEKVHPMYPRAIMTFWHCAFSTPADPMIIAGDPFMGTGYVTAFPRGTIDRAVFSGTVDQNRPWETKVGTRNALTPNFNVNMACTYDQGTRLLTVRVTGTALTALTGDWRLNAYVVEDSISSGLSSAYNQKNIYNPPATLSHATGSPSYFIGAGNPITSGALYSHMHVARAILCPGGNIWGEAAFSNPASGTSVTKTYTYTIPASYVAKNMKVIGLVQKYGATTTDRVVENAVQVKVPGAPVLFTGGHSQSLAICQGASATSINALMAVSDTYVGHSVSWSLVSGPYHGAASATYSTTSTGGILSPTGLTYTPLFSYSGLDTFRVRVADGADVDTTTIYVTVNPSPAAITGSLAICIAGTSLLSSTPSGGVWTSGSASVATIGAASGIASGISAGTSGITYTLPTGCKTTAIATVSATPSAGTITGTTSICTSASATLSSSVPGGTWSSSATGVATVGLSSGTVSGITPGTAIISYSVSTSCGTVTSTITVTVVAAPVAGTITGPSVVCEGATITLTSSAPGGSWTSGATGIATVGSSTGIVTGLTAGTATISYSVTGTCGVASATHTITVNPLPAAITGSLFICVAGTSTLSSSPSGGTWTSGSTTIATIGAASGIASGISAGTSGITYTLSTGCRISAIATVSATPSAGTITGTTSICMAASATLSSSVPGGTWSSGATGIATVGLSSGLVTGMATGTAVISYTTTTSCGTATTTVAVTVISLPAAGTISGSSTLCVGAVTTLTSSTGGGTWSSGATGIATVGSSTGIVSGVSSGSVTITYTVTSSCGIATATFNVIVTAPPVAGTITGASGVCEGATTTLTSSMPGGSWSSGTIGVATVGTFTGIVTGVSPGTATITYSLAGMCGVATATHLITVDPLPVPGTIAGLTSVCETQTITLTDAVGGGVWSSSSANATVDAAGVVTGVTAGTVTISYTVTNGCGSASATSNITVIPASACPLSTSLPEDNGLITVYPNPVKDELYIAISGIAPWSTGALSITNSVGMELLHSVLGASKNVISLRSLPPGMYIVTITPATGQRIIRKIVKD